MRLLDWIVPPDALRWDRVRERVARPATSTPNPMARQRKGGVPWPRLRRKVA